MGYPVSAEVTLRNEGRAPLVVEAIATGPFSASPGHLELSVGASLAITLTFAPQAPGSASGELRLAHDGVVLPLPLQASAEVAPACPPPGPCLVSAFDPASGTCLTAPADEGQPCTTPCLTSARCVAGRCLGLPLNCDDGDACTEDICGSSGACLHLPRSCPAPADPCQAPVCDPQSGCGQTRAPDGTACGTSNCTISHVCLSGACREVPTPEGSACGEVSPCQPSGVCRSGACDQPDAGVLQPEWTHTLYEVPNGGDPPFGDVCGVLLDQDENLYVGAWRSDGGSGLLSLTSAGDLRWVRAAADGEPHCPAALTGGMLLTSPLGARSVRDGSLLWISGAATWSDLGFATTGAEALALSPWYPQADPGVSGVAVATGDGSLLWQTPTIEFQISSDAGHGLPCPSPLVGTPAFDGQRLLLGYGCFNPSVPTLAESALAAFDLQGHSLWVADGGAAPMLIDQGRVLDSIGGVRSVTDGSLLFSLGGQVGPAASDGEHLWAVIFNVPSYQVWDLAGGQLSAQGQTWWNAWGFHATSRQSVLAEIEPGNRFESTSRFAEVDALGAQRWICTFTGRSLRQSVWALGSTGALGRGRFYRLAYVYEPGTWVQRVEVQAYSLPGIEPAPHGWVAPQGNAARTGAPR